MHTIHKILLIGGLYLIAPFSASAQSIQDLQAMSPEDKRIYMESMSPDERAAMQEKWRGEFENLSEEEKQVMRQQRSAARGDRERNRDRDAMRERWESMSDEERAAMKERRKAKEVERRARWEAMSEEERAAAREKRAQHKGDRGQQQRKHGETRQQPETQQPEPQ